MRLHTLRNERGVTLFETLVAGIMAGILMAAALPSLSSSLNAHSLQASLRSTSNYVRLVRSVAVTRNTSAKLVITEEGRHLSIEALEGGTWTAVGTPLVLEGGVRVQSVSPGTLEFRSQGTTTAATTLTLATASGATGTVAVSLLGNAQVS